MRCDELAELTIDYLSGALDEETRRATDEHLGSCAACRSELAELATVWGALGRLPAARPPADLALRFRKALEASPEGRAARSSSWLARPAAQAAAALLVLGIGLAAGIAIQRATGARQERTADDGRHQFVLLLYDTDEMRRLAPGEEARLVEEYSAWGRELAGAGDLVGGEKLAAEFRMLAAGSTGALTTPGLMGGFFIVKARTYEEAAAIARGCPHLAHGGTIEVRMIEPT
jgi:hypothetical protein